ncbi:MAG TPA: RNA polymerase factor sigma-54 [Stellaceae bacterium]|nr:RNA polymerase factor sigma-54 [Stellaceae bacterium]
MGFSQRLELRQSQTLVMTPQLQQAIKMLQLSNLELAEFIEAEIEQNPLLERQDRSAAPAAEPAEEGTSPPLGSPDFPDTLAEAAEHWRAASGTEEGDGSIDLAGDPQAWRSGNGAEWPGLDQTAARSRTLREHLAEQIGADLGDPGDRVIALHLLDLLDEAGYLRDAPAAVAETLGCGLARVEAVLARLQQFDPAGVFARDLRECLLLQLRERGRLDPPMEVLLDNLPLLAARNVAALCRLCHVEPEELARMIAAIKALDPRPGYAFDPPLAQPVVPDILMRVRPQGGWTIELNPETLPRVLVNHRYHKEISRTARNKTEKDYLSERFNAANWLVRSLHQRATTILKVAAEIVRQQDAFFRRGVQALRPLILRDVADAIGMHESTVSRVTANKYMATPRGLFELKYFFTSAIPASRGGDAHSAEAVRSRIRGLIDREPPEETLSDERIVELLQQEGIDIARRTVAKYREAMRIPSSVQRRREKLLAL